ncbi:MAG TPA: phosphoglucosamine mutase, partial [Thermoanaerobaculia bacterium]|nr:phosphoglucosamine mutase [Thermoanaerobaculia bacterium]
MPRLFGTDGIRGAFGAEPLDRATVTALGVALGQELGRAGGEPFVVLAGDTRDSTPTLAAWLASGLGRANVAVRFGGVLPTPAVAFLARRLGAACGVAISASHNPHPDNGIKLIDAAGYKWSPENEAAIESALIALRPAVAAENEPSPPSLEPDPELGALYRRFLLEAAPGPRCLAGLRIALDLANGAAYRLAPDLFTRLGAEVEVFAAEPDGTNINRGCGSTHPEALAARLRAGGFDLGVAFDGDADRAILVDETGEIRDGDAILYLWADALAGEGRLSPARLVATSMSNLGLERALGRLGVGVERCNVGDREVVATLLAEGLTLGGEQSGHIVNLELATTGDGLQTALHLAA